MTFEIENFMPICLSDTGRSQTEVLKVIENRLSKVDNVSKATSEQGFSTSRVVFQT